MGYYVIRQEEEFIVESPLQIIRIYCDVDGKMRIQRDNKTKHPGRVRKVYMEVNQNDESKR